MQTAFHFCIILTKREFGRQILVKTHNPIFHEIHLVGKQLFRANGGTNRRSENRKTKKDRHDEAYILFLQLFCEHAKKL